MTLPSPPIEYRVASGEGALSLHAWNQRAPQPNGAPPVIYVHGATFGSRLSVGYRFDGHSWADDLNQAGFDVWGFDLLGFGQSDRYPEMAQPASEHPPLGRAAAAARQVAAVAALVRRESGASRVSLVAHSWGTMAACLYAAAEPDAVARLVLFGAILRRHPDVVPIAPPSPAYQLVSIEAQWKRFNEDLPAGHNPVLSRAHFEPWAAEYLASDPASSTRNPPAVQVPFGPAAEIAAAWAGKLAYDPTQLRHPFLIVRGAWDSLCNDADVAVFFAEVGAAAAGRDVVVPEATHLMHLEQNRCSLYRAASEFLLQPNLPRPS